MGIQLKFNIVLITVFLAGFGFTAATWHQLLQRTAKDEILRNARLMMQTAIAIRGYTVSQVRPHLEPLLERAFLPQSVPAYAATETLAELRKPTPTTATKRRHSTGRIPVIGLWTGKPTS